MMRAPHSLIVAIALLAVTGTARTSLAFQQANSDASRPATEAQIREYFDLTGMEAATHTNLLAEVDESRTNSAPFVPEAIWAEIKAECLKINIISLAIPIYERHFTESDMREALIFYRTPIGRKFLRESVLVTNEVSTILGEKTSTIARGVYAKHQRELEEAERRYRQNQR